MASFVKFSFIAFFCLIPVIYISGQGITIETKRYNHENGLSDYANYIHKDSRGIIWVGTQFGLYRFDGQEFVHFDEKSGLPFRQIMEIYEDTEGWFWLYKSCRNKPNCIRDLAFFHPLTKEVMTFQQRFGGKTSVRAYQIAGIVQDRTDIYFTANHKLLIWSSGQGIREVSVKGLETTPVLWTKLSDGVLGAYIRDLQEASVRPRTYPNPPFQNLILDTTGNVLQKSRWVFIEEAPHLRSDYRKARHFPFDSSSVKELDLSFQADGVLHAGSLSLDFIYMFDSIYYPYFNKNYYTKNEEKAHHAERTSAADVDPTSDSNFSTSSRLQEVTQAFFIKSHSSSRHSQSTHHLGTLGSRDIFFDWKRSTFWQADPEGIKISEFTKKRFRNITYKSKRPGDQRASDVMITDDQNVLLIFNRGLYHLAQGDTLKLIHLREKNIIYQFAREEADSTVWLVGRNDLYELDLRNFKITRHVHRDDIRTRKIYKSGNKIWVEGSGRLHHYFIAQDSFAPFLRYNQYAEFQNEVHFFKKATDKHFWLGTNDGLFWCSEEKGLLHKYGNTETDHYYLPADDFYHMSESKTGGYWLATKDGLIHFTPDNLQINNIDSTSSITYRQYTTETGLPTDEILAAYEDDYGFLWLPTPHGLIQFQISSALSKTYLKSDGLTHSAFQEYAHFQGEDGTLYFGGYTGFNIFHPKDFKDVELQPEIPIIILDYEQYVAATDSIEYRLRQITETGEIILQPGDKFFNIRIAMQDYREADKHRFSHKIEGYHSDWLEDKSNLIRISGLPYGSYTLKIRGRMQDGQFARPILEIPIHVLKPFYLKTAFFVLATLAFLLVVFLFYQWRIRNLKKQQRKLEQTVKERTAQIKKDKQTIEQQAAELQELDRVKSRFFANVSHELRTPLTLILGPLGTLLKDNVSSYTRSKLIKTARQNGHALLKLVNEILDLTKLESGKLELHEEKIVLYPLVYRIVSSFESHAERQNIDFQLEYEARQDLQIKLDIGKFRVLLNNLLSNAFKFTPKGGEIGVMISDKGSHIRLEVADTGRGIHAEDLPHIFNRFYQSKQPNAVAEGGTGIGLALCQEYARLFKGSLRAKSEVGKGSTFIFEFPKKEIIQSLTDEAALEIKNTEMAATDKASKQNVLVFSAISENDETHIKNKANILLVEDNHSLRNYLRLITEEDYSVYTAENGEEALKMLTENALPPSLIISDIMMPIMDGFQLLEKLKSSDRWRHIPIIMLTARAELSDKLKALRIGVDDYLTKPFEEEELLVRIANLLENAGVRELWRENADTESGDGSKPEKVPVILSEEDVEWLRELETAVRNNQDSDIFSVESLTSALFMSRRQLQRRIRQLTGMSPHQYIHENRMQYARKLLENQSKTSVKAVSYAIGINDVKYFSRQFKKRFGKLPSAYF